MQYAIEQIHAMLVLTLGYRKTIYFMFVLFFYFHCACWRYSNIAYIDTESGNIELGHALCIL